MPADDVDLLDENRQERGYGFRKRTDRQIVKKVLISMCALTQAKTDLSSRGALHVFDGVQFSGQLFSHLTRNRLKTVLCQLFYFVQVVALVNLRSDNDERRPLAVVCYLWNPLNTHSTVNNMLTSR